MADHIQIGDISPRIQYTGDGVQTVFTYPFPIFADADMEVYEDATLKTITTHYTVSGAGNSSGGSVTFVTAPANAVTVTLKRQLAIQRTSDFQESGEFRSKVINDELDILTASLQQVDGDVSRSLRLSSTDTANTLTLPDKTTRTSMYLGFDANGDPIATDASGPQGPTGPAGNMDGSNNLSEVVTPATALFNIGGIGAATTDTLTNKTFDANGTGNALSNVDVADLANGTDGELISWDAAGAPATVGVGTSGQVLTSNGAGAAPTMQTPAAGGAWNYVATVTASAAASADFDGVLDNTYDRWIIVATDVFPATNATDLYCRTDSNGGASWDSGAGDYSWGFSGGTSGTAMTSGLTSATEINMRGTHASATWDNSATNASLFTMEINNPGNASDEPSGIFTLGYVDSDDTDFMAQGVGSWTRHNGGAAIDSIQFFAASGNISGVFRLYGITDS